MDSTSTWRRNLELRAFGFALGVLQVPVARALVLVPICPRWNALTLTAADPTELHASVLHPSLRAPLCTLGGAET